MNRIIILFCFNFFAASFHYQHLKKRTPETHYNNLILNNIIKNLLINLYQKDSNEIQLCTWISQQPVKEDFTSNFTSISLLQKQWKQQHQMSKGQQLSQPLYHGSPVCYSTLSPALPFFVLVNNKHFRRYQFCCFNLQLISICFEKLLPISQSPRFLLFPGRLLFC